MSQSYVSFGCTWRFMPTLHYITPLQRLRPVCITLPADANTTLHYATLRLQPFAAVAYYLIYIYSVQLLNTYLNLKRSTDRFTPFHANCLRFRALSVGGGPYLPPKRTAQPFHDIFLFLYFPILQFLFPRYSRIIFFIFFYIKHPLIPYALFICPYLPSISHVISLYILYR